LGPERSHAAVTPLRRLSAAMLSLVLVIVGVVLTAFGVICAIVSVQMAAEKVEVPTVIVACLLLIASLGLILAGLRFITRVRPWVVRRFSGCEVPRIPAPIAWLATAPGGASFED